MDIIVDLAAGGSLIVGPMSVALDVHFAGNVDLFGVRFHPGALPAFIRHPAHRLLDERLELGAVWRPEADSLRDALFDASSISDRAGIMDRMLLRHLPVLPPPAVAGAVAALQASRGALPIGEIARDLGISRRQLERLFAEHVGLSPKVTARIVRFRQSVEALLDNRSIRWAQFAVDCGYFDQAHFIRDFRTFSGTTPEMYRLERSHALNVASVQS